MIVGRAICKILDGMTITVNSTDITVLNNMGNQDALDKFIAASDSAGVDKFPLIFYVIAPVRQFGEWSHCRTELIIMSNTKEPLLYKDRTETTYVPYIEPIYQKMVSTLKSNVYFQNEENNELDKFSYTDVPNFGIRKNEIGTNNSSESVVTEYVDARIVKMNFRIKTNCI